MQYIFLLIWGKISPEAAKLMKEAYKDEYFGESTIFRWHDDLKKGRRFSELAWKSSGTLEIPGRAESAVNNQNVNIVVNLAREFANKM